VQAEDGIRDRNVTGVQTCALPIFPLSWFRLSVVGSLAYELLAAEMTVSGLGYDSLSQFITTDDISSAISIMFVMGISIIGGIVFMIFFGKRLQTGLLNYQEKN